MASLRRAASDLFDRLPRPIQMRLRPSAFGLARRDLPAPIVAPEAGRRLLIAPAIYAGAAITWARAAEGIPAVAARNMVPRDARGFGFPADDEVPTTVYLWSARWQRDQFRAVTEGFSHVLIEAERPIFGTMFGSHPADSWTSVRAEVHALRAAGVKTATVSHGSDLRLPSRHAAREPDSPFAMRANSGRLSAEVLDREFLSR